ncbi:MAG: ABC transporter substrate-binding protein [Gemmatimonadota bacterium]
MAACSADSGEPSSRRPAPAATAETGIQVEDDSGRTIRLTRPAGRIVSLVPSVTETIVALDLAGRLVARTDYDRGQAVADLPSVGGGLDPSSEALVALEPDLVIAWRSARGGGFRQALRSADIPVYSASIEDTADVFRTFGRLGTLLGVPAVAGRLAQELRDSLAAVAADRLPDPRPTVLFTLLGSPPRTAGPGTFVAQILDIAGGRLAFPELGERWPEVSLEAIVERQPDVLIVPVDSAMDPRALLSDRPGWRDLRAVRTGRVKGVDADLFSRPGPRLAEAARELQRALAP